MKFIFCSLISLISFGYSAHEYFFSHTDIVEKEHSYEISCNIYIDDLEQMFKSNGNDSLFLGTENENLIADSLLNNYLKDKLILTINNKTANWEWIGKETSEDLMSFWIYLEVAKKEETKSLKILNEILTESLYDQKNIVNIVLEDNTKHFLLFQKNSKAKTIQ
jgi:hypothetical protein